MLGNDYIVIDGIGFTPSSFDYNFNPIEESNQSEAGTELVSVTRLDKKIFNLGFTAINSTLLDSIEGLCKKKTVTVKYRDKEYVCRARGFAPKLAPMAHKYKRSDGIWDVTINLTEI